MCRDAQSDCKVHLSVDQKENGLKVALSWPKVREEKQGGEGAVEWGGPVRGEASLQAITDTRGGISTSRRGKGRMVDPLELIMIISTGPL